MADSGEEKVTQTFHIRMGSDRPPGSGRKSDRKSERPRLPCAAFLYNKSKSDMMSYEDLLVAQYVEVLKKQNKEVHYSRKEKNLPPSPYLQRLPHNHLRYGKMRYRTMSAMVVGSRPSSAKPKIDAKFIADTSIWDPASPRNFRRTRPASAPVRRPQSGTSIRSRPGSGRKNSFRKQPHIIKAFAYKNGSRDNFVHLAAPTIKILLEFATEKLGLPFAGRRIFLEDGLEIFSEHDIPPEGDIYISMGEKYKDPYHNEKRNIVVRQSSRWTLTGVILPTKGRKKGVKPRMSKRMRALCENKKVRIMIYKNGQSMEPAEVVADLQNLDDFFICCTGKLDLRSHARVAYDWDGNEITNLSDTPILDDSIVHQGKTPFLGPLWISIGEPFNTAGTQGFLQMIHEAVKDKLKKAMKYKKEVDLALDNDKDNVTDTMILSMTADELYEAAEKVDDEIEAYEDTLKHLKERLDKLTSKKKSDPPFIFDYLSNKQFAKGTLQEGMQLQMQYSSKGGRDDRLVGTRGIKLKVFENGSTDGDFIFFFNLREAMKGKDLNKEKLLQRLLDDISGTRFAGSISHSLKAVAQKMYDQFGHEITNVYSLQNEQSVWISFGEPYICPFTYCLHLEVDRATPVTDSDGAQRIVREVLQGPEQMELAKDISKWEATIGFPALYQPDEVAMFEYDAEKISNLLTYAEVDPRNHFLLLKDVFDKALFTEVSVTEKRLCKNQTFVISKSGQIYCKASPLLCLAVSDIKVEARLFDKDVAVEGFMVSMQKKMIGNPSQIWRFNTDATICSEAYPNLLLTYLGNKAGDEEGYFNNQPQGAKTGERVTLVVADPLPKKEMSAQRFALKQERFDNIGQWKFTEASNQEWNKQAYSWPVTEDGSLNEKYDWPMEGYLLPNAPPLHKSGKKVCGINPVKLRVLKNGERCEDMAVHIVGPNMANFGKDSVKKKSKSKQRMQETEEDDEIHFQDFTVHEHELLMFLDHCTCVLDLPFAARRLFDTTGRELFTIQGLERNQLLFVSCGETWCDPKLSRVEQKRRFLLSQLSADVTKIEQFCALRNPENYVLEVAGSVTTSASLIVNKMWSAETEETRERGEADGSRRSSEMLKSMDDQDQQTSEDKKDLTYHEISHLHSEERLNSLKWPWERLINVNNSMDTEDPEANKYSDREMYEKFKPQSASRVSRDTLQRFSFEDGFIAVLSNRSMVLSVSEVEGRIKEVHLTKRRPDDISQRWLIRENGEIRSKLNQHMVLTVSMPATGSEENVSLTFRGCPITLQARRTNMFGKAHQRWRYDAETGFIHAFDTELPDKEITAANKADVCTYAIAQVANIDQPGYILEVPGDKQGSQELKVCLSCARAMRGRFKMQKLPLNTNFHCAMGDAKKLGMRQIGSFRVLNNKVDLSTHEAELSLAFWKDTLLNLRKQTSVNSIAKEINAAKTVRTVKVMAYKNGEGRLRKGEVICGSSVQGILNQCNQHLNMTHAARRIYLEDGSMVLDVEDLVEHAVDSCRSEMINMLLLNKEEAQLQTDNRAKEEGLDLEDDAVRLQRFHEAANKEIDGQMRRTLGRMSKADRKSSGGRGRGGEEEEEEEQEDDEEEDVPQKDVDEEEALKIKRERDMLLGNMQLPPLDIILRAPIEVWISSGKSFVSPEVVESKEENRRKKRQFRAQVCLALDIDKHILRQMKGRRLEKMEPGVYKSTLSSTQPVIIEKNWQELTVEEQVKHHSVHKLQSHLGEIRSNQFESRTGFQGIDLNGKLYEQPVLKRVMVYPNGETAERCVNVWGSSIDEILESATMKLGLWKNAKILYNLEGQRIECFSEIQKDQLLCVSTGRSFLQTASQRVNVEIKANWGRARKQYGSRTTDVIVDVKKNAEVNVDPFGPPLLALPVEDTRPRQSSQVQEQS